MSLVHYLIPKPLFSQRTNKATTQSKNKQKFTFKNCSCSFYLHSMRNLLKNFKALYSMYKCTILTCQYTCKIFSRKKSNRDTVQKQNIHRLNCSRAFYLLSIRSKKMDCSEFHKHIHDFELPIHWDFF